MKLKPEVGNCWNCGNHDEVETIDGKINCKAGKIVYIKAPIRNCAYWISGLVPSDSLNKYSQESNNLETIQANLEIIMAIETLECHNKNYLCGNEKTRNEAKRSLMAECFTLLGTTAFNQIG